jgi:CheY-like chemotaxis protein
MSIISIFSGSHCQAEDVTRRLVDQAGYRLLSEKEVVFTAGRHSGLAPKAIEEAFIGRFLGFNAFTHERERAVAALRLALAENLAADGLLITGFITHLIPQRVTHALRVCLIASLKSRAAIARPSQGARRKAVEKIRGQDEALARWVGHLTKSHDPWAPSLYDIVIPMDKVLVPEATALILEHIRQEVLRPTLESRQAVDDFRLAARVELALVKEGYSMPVEADNGSISLIADRPVMMLKRFDEELKSIVGGIPEVRSMEIRAGEKIQPIKEVRSRLLERPSKVLLVDDEREFVQVLSKRLLMRDMGPAVAFDGETALAMISEKESEPEVMILDLRMPGVDGIEVLRRVKQMRPEIEVIILTGQGSEVNRRICMELGAFAFLAKPVDIDVLTATLKKANEKNRLAQQLNSPSPQ